MKIKFLKAFNGDSILISYLDKSIKRNILIDGGVRRTYSRRNPKKKGVIEYGELHETIKSIKKKNEKIDLLILSHVDDDHIAGILKWFENDTNIIDIVDKVWFNSGSLIKENYETNKKLEYDNSLVLKNDTTLDTSITQGVKFETFIEENRIWDRKIIKNKQELELLGVKFQFLSPSEQKLKLLLGKWAKERPDSLDTSSKKNDYDLSLTEHISQDIKFEEDDSVHNGSSISFILNYKGKRLLFLADSHPTDIINSLKYFGSTHEKPLPFEFVKISHHGSKKNMNKELFQLISCTKYVISTNGDRHSHPHKKLLARLINEKNHCEIYFNYPILINGVFSEKDKIDFPHFKALPMLNNEIEIYE